MMLHASFALVTVIDDDNERQVFKASRGPDGQPLKDLSTPLSFSLCNHVRLRGGTVVIRDLSLDRSFRDHPAQRECGIKAYLGAPLLGPANDPIGAVCAAETHPRVWSDRDKAAIENFAALAAQQVLLRASLQTLKMIA
ncbi:multi-sensor hybrid histidine kinase [Salipiger mucosus DSM 16094]|uniref:Multi-sensor hybrid histidine kinase n=2 Tax=Salipiger mucosus TaxID=263378 RepID=S9QDE9_9RHOB|nr:multi-sensor hybrid histidine kinase [Salipiger mucosus DSM 16094]